MAALIFLLCASPFAARAGPRFASLAIIPARNSGSSQRRLRVSEMRRRTDGRTLPGAAVLLVMSSR